MIAIYQAIDWLKLTVWLALLGLGIGSWVGVFYALSLLFQVGGAQ